MNTSHIIVSLTLIPGLITFLIILFSVDREKRSTEDKDGVVETEQFACKFHNSYYYYKNPVVFTLMLLTPTKSRGAPLKRRLVHILHDFRVPLHSYANGASVWSGEVNISDCYRTGPY